MELDRLSESLRSEEGIDHLISLFPPEDSELSRVKADQYHAVLKVFYRLWREFLIDEARIPRGRFELNVEHSDGPLILEGIDLWTYVFLTIAGCYDYVLRRYLSLDRKEQSDLPPGLNLHEMKQLFPEDTDGKPAVLYTAGVFSYHYFQCVFTLHFTKLFRPLPVPGGPVGVFESTYHSTVRRLFQWVVTTEELHLIMLGQRLLTSILEYADEVYSDELPWNREHPWGPFSAIRIQELALLAKRDPSVIRRYGDKHIAKIFEKQLALIAQSFGLYVVSTRAGSQTVDLVCISSHPDVIFPR